MFKKPYRRAAGRPPTLNPPVRPHPAALAASLVAMSALALPEVSKAGQGAPTTDPAQPGLLGGGSSVAQVGDPVNGKVKSGKKIAPAAATQTVQTNMGPDLTFTVTLSPSNIVEHYNQGGFNWGQNDLKTTIIGTCILPLTDGIAAGTAFTMKLREVVMPAVLMSVSGRPIDTSNSDYLVGLFPENKVARSANPGISPYKMKVGQTNNPAGRLTATPLPGSIAGLPDNLDFNPPEELGLHKRPYFLVFSINPTSPADCHTVSISSYDPLNPLCFFVGHGGG